MNEHAPPSRTIPSSCGPVGASDRAFEQSPLPSSLTGTALLLAAAAVAIVLVALPAAPAAAQSLRGSPGSLDIQNRMARQHDFTYLSNASQLNRFVSSGYLVRLNGNRDYTIHNVSFPYARPQVRTFVQRLANQYRNACGEKLVVTSLTRPQTHQPRNASDRSVHPTGMAVDLRRSNRTVCRNWIESVLVSLERQGVVEATRESRPPHYHIAVFPEPYAQYVARITAVESLPTATAGPLEYQVKRGDTLWKIAQTMGVSIVDLRVANGLSSDRIHPGQLLRMPVSGERMAGGLDYQVQSGDSLWKIASAYNTSVTRIRQENGLRSNRIRPGQVLTVPVGQ